MRPRLPDPPHRRRRSAPLAVAALGLLALPVGATAATPFPIAPAGTGQSVLRDAAGTTYVAYVRPASSGGGQSVGYCRIPAGGSGCATSLELPFPGPGAGGPQAVGRTALTFVPGGPVRVWASCFNCAGDVVGAPDYSFRWTATSNANTSFPSAVPVGKDAGTGDGTAAPLETVADWGLVAAGASGQIQLREYAGTYPTSFAALSPISPNYHPSVVAAPDGRLVYATDDGDRIVSSTYKKLTPGFPTPAMVNDGSNWSPAAAPDADDGNTSSIGGMALASGPSGTYLSYSYFVPLDERLRLRRFDVTTKRFGPAVEIQGNSAFDDSVSDSTIAEDPSGRVHAVWESLGEVDRLRYARTDANGNAASTLGTLARGERFIDPRLAAGPGDQGLAVWHGNGNETPLRAVALEPVDEQPPAPPGDGGSGGGGGVVTPPVVTPPKAGPPAVAAPPKPPTRSTTVSVPGGTLSFTTPRTCVPRGGTISVRMAFQAKRRKKAASGLGNVVVKVRRADFYVGSKRVKRDTKAPFVQRITVSPKSRPGSTVKLRAVASLKVRKTSRPRTTSLRATVQVCR